MTQHAESDAPRPFTRTFLVRWADMDFNAHMRNTAYLDMSADTRMLYFQEHAFSMREFERLRIGPSCGAMRWSTSASCTCSRP